MLQQIIPPLKLVKLELPHCQNQPGEKVNSHKNAQLTVGGREEMIRRMHAADVEVAIGFWRKHTRCQKVDDPLSARRR